MATRNLRNRVSSRLSSPTITVDVDQADDSDADRNGKGRSDEWVEPPVRRLPPSYQDHKGLERVGVLELQQPLGEPPSQKLMQRLKLNFNRSSNRATPMQNDEGVTPSVESDRPEFGSPREAERLSEPPQQDLPPEPREQPMVISSPPRGRPAKRDADEMRHQGYPPNFTPSPFKHPSSPHRIVPLRKSHSRSRRFYDRIVSQITSTGQLRRQRGRAIWDCCLD